jgi:hypothetical protein
LYNNSSTFIDLSDLPFRLHVQLHSARAACFPLFSDLICSRRLDLARLLFDLSFLHSTLRARIGTWGEGRKEEEKSSNLGQLMEVLAVRPLMLLSKGSRLQVLLCLLFGGSTRISRAFRP